MSPRIALLMEVLARSGEPAAALVQYRDCVRILDRELGVAPLVATVDLADAIRAGLISHDREAPAAADTPSALAAGSLHGASVARGSE